MKILIRLFIANAAIVVCTGIASLLPGLWPGAGGRDFLPQAFNTAVLILAVSVIIRCKVKWPILHMILCLIPVQFITLISISFFSGYSILQIFGSFDLFYDLLQWMLLVDLFIGIPWIAGAFIGTLFFKD